MRVPILVLIRFLWFGIFVLWTIAGFALKPTARSRSEGRARAAIWVATFGWLLLFDTRIPILTWRFFPDGPAALNASAFSGVALTIIGLAFAVWARFSLGGNWSAMVTVTQDHKLMRTGPYGIVRHPIYSGFILASLGTAIAQGTALGLLGLVLVTLAWAYKSRVEESLMIEQFGGEYEQYRHQVKALIPLVW